MKKKIYIFDLDHTLFNAKDFREEIGILLSNNPNIISEDIWNYFNAEDKILMTFIKQNSKKFLFSGVLKNLKKIKEEKILLTYGNKNFQKMKIESLFLNKIFDKIFLTDKSKMFFLTDFVKKNKDKQIFFINDNYNKRFSENADINKQVPEITVFEVDNYNKNRNIHINQIISKLY